MTVYSHSRLSCFEQCALRFKFNYIDKVETEVEESIEAFMGKRVHEVLEKIYKDAKFHKIPELKELLKLYNDEWEKNWNDQILIVRKEYGPENFKKIGEKAITDFYKRYHPFKDGKTIGTEMLIMVDINGKKLRGYVDRLSCDNEGVYTIHDYKTSGTLPDQNKLDEDRQLALYSIAIKEKFKDCKKVRLVWHYLVFDKELESSRTDEELEKLKKEVCSVIDKIENAKDFKSNTSKLCDWCEFMSMCPEWKHKAGLEEKEPNEFLSDDGVTLVNKFAVLKEQEKKITEDLDKIKEALVEFANKNNINAVFGSDLKALVRTYPRSSFPNKDDPLRQDFFKTIRDIGLWDQLAEPNVYELAKMINNNDINEELVRLLDKYITKGETIWVKLVGI